MNGVVTKACIVLVFLLPHKHQDKRFDANRHVWAKCKPGTYISYELTEKGPPEGDVVQTITVRLEKVEADGFILSESRKSKTGVTRKDLSVDFPSYLKSEDLNIGGEKIKCSVWQWETRCIDSVEKTILWFDQDYRAQKLSWVRGRGTPDELTRELLRTGNSQELKIADKTLLCTRMEGTFGNRVDQLRVVEWWSDEVPGGIARGQLSPNKEQATSVSTLETIEIGRTALSDPVPFPVRKR
jgi:hypothetical protein